jgi:hypothetical protein
MTWANSVLPMFMRHPRVVKPASIAKMKNGIQIVDTHEWLEARLSIAFAAYRP